MLPPILQAESNTEPGSEGADLIVLNETGCLEGMAFIPPLAASRL